MKAAIVLRVCFFVLFSSLPLAQSAVAGQELVHDKEKIREIMKHIKTNIEQLTRSAKEAVRSTPGTRQYIKMAIGSGTDQKDLQAFVGLAHVKSGLYTGPAPRMIRGFGTLAPHPST